MTGRVGVVGTKLGIGGRPPPVGIGRLGSIMRCKSGGGAGVTVGITGRLGSTGSKSKFGIGGTGNIVGAGVGGTTAGLVITGRPGSGIGCRIGGGGGGSGWPSVGIGGCGGAIGLVDAANASAAESDGGETTGGGGSGVLLSGTSIGVSCVRPGVRPLSETDKPGDVPAPGVNINSALSPTESGPPLNPGRSSLTTTGGNRSSISSSKSPGSTGDGTTGSPVMWCTSV